MEFEDVIQGSAIEVTVDEPLQGIYFKLLAIVSSLDTLKLQQEITPKDVGAIQNKLHSVDIKYREAAIKKQGIIPGGQAVISELLNEAFEAVHELVCRLPEDVVESEDVAVQATSGELSQSTPAVTERDELKDQDDVQAELENLLVALEGLQNKRYLRKAEVAKLQSKIKELELNAVGKTLTYLDLKLKFDVAYALVYDLLNQTGVKKDLSTSIDESLWPLETELKKVIHSLHALRKKPIKSIQEKDVRYAADKLHKVDAAYAEGRFANSGNEIPKGQAVLSSMLNKAHQMMYDIMSRLPDEPEPQAV